MPFDSTNFRSANIRLAPAMLRESGHDVRLPPAAPNRRGGGGPRRVHIVIEVRLPAPPRHRSRIALWWWFVALMVVALAAHAQPTEWRSYPFGSGVNSYGTDAKGREWTARSYDLGSTTYTTITGPDGKEQRCSSYMLGSTRYTRCD
jgi:hypothetical protein